MSMRRCRPPRANSSESAVCRDGFERTFGIHPIGPAAPAEKHDVIDQLGDLALALQVDSARIRAQKLAHKATRLARRVVELGWSESDADALYLAMLGSNDAVLQPLLARLDVDRHSENLAYDAGSSARLAAKVGWPEPDVDTLYFAILTHNDAVAQPLRARLEREFDAHRLKELAVRVGWPEERAQSLARIKLDCDADPRHASRPWLQLQTRVLEQTETRAVWAPYTRSESFRTALGLPRDSLSKRIARVVKGDTRESERKRRAAKENLPPPLPP